MRTVLSSGLFLFANAINEAMGAGRSEWVRRGEGLARLVVEDRLNDVSTPWPSSDQWWRKVDDVAVLAWPKPIVAQVFAELPRGLAVWRR